MKLFIVYGRRAMQTMTDLSKTKLFAILGRRATTGKHRLVVGVNGKGDTEGEDRGACCRWWRIRGKGGRKARRWDAKVPFEDSYFPRSLGCHTSHGNTVGLSLSLSLPLLSLPSEFRCLGESFSAFRSFGFVYSTGHLSSSTVIIITPAGAFLSLLANP